MQIDLLRVDFPGICFILKAAFVFWLNVVFVC